MSHGNCRTDCQHGCNPRTSAPIWQRDHHNSSTVSRTLTHNLGGQQMATLNDSEQQQKRIVQRVRPCGNAEAAEHVEAAERETAEHAESERLQLERIAKRADVVKCRKDDGADND